MLSWASPLKANNNMFVPNMQVLNVSLKLWLSVVHLYAVLMLQTEEWRTTCLLWQINALHPPHIVIKPRCTKLPRETWKRNYDCDKSRHNALNISPHQKKCQAERTRGITITTADWIQSNMSVWLADNKMRKATSTNETTICFIRHKESNK